MVGSNGSTGAIGIDFSGSNGSTGTIGIDFSGSNGSTGLVGIDFFGSSGSIGTVGTYTIGSPGSTGTGWNRPSLNHFDPGDSHVFVLSPQISCYYLEIQRTTVI